MISTDKQGMFGVCLILAAMGLGHTAATGSPAITVSSPARAEEQLAALTEDRPQLAASLQRRPTVRAWIVERFRVTDPPLFWDPAPPISGRRAECDVRDPERSFVRVDGERSGIDQLTVLIFELHNIQGYAAFDVIHESALRGEIGREDYAEAMLSQEFEALLAARRFFRDELSDLTELEQREARAYWRLSKGTDSFEEHLRESQERGHDLLDHWRAIYETEVLPELKE